MFSWRGRAEIGVAAYSTKDFGVPAKVQVLAPGPSSSRSQRQDDLAPVDDIMVKDPFCQTYIPKRDGIQEVINGQTYFFCSAQCRDKYINGTVKASE